MIGKLETFTFSKLISAKSVNITTLTVYSLKTMAMLRLHSLEGQVMEINTVMFK